MTVIAPPLAQNSLAELREYIHRTLCRHENLLPDQSPMRELLLMRDGRSCGIQFVVQGPRAVQLSAIWDSNLKVVNFYDATGERYLKVPLRDRLGRTADAA